MLKKIELIDESAGGIVYGDIEWKYIRINSCVFDKVENEDQ